MNEIQKHLTDNISIKFSDLDQETIDYIDDSDLRFGDEKEPLKKVLKEYGTYRYLHIINFPEPYGYVLAFYDHQPIATLSLSEFQEAVGMKKLIEIPQKELYNFPDGTELILKFEDGNKLVGIKNSNCIDFKSGKSFTYNYLVSNKVKFYIYDNCKKLTVDDMPKHNFTPTSNTAFTLSDEQLIVLNSLLSEYSYLDGKWFKITGGDYELYFLKHNANYIQVKYDSLLPRFEIVNHKTSYTTKKGGVFERVMNKLFSMSPDELQIAVEERKRELEKIKITTFPVKWIPSVSSQFTEELFEIINRREEMFEEKTIIKSMKLKEIHEEILPEIGKQICDKLGTEYREVDRKVYLVKGLIPPTELTVEKIEELLVKKLTGQDWSKVKDSKSMKILWELKLIKTIELEYPEETIEDLLK